MLCFENTHVFHLFLHLNVTYVSAKFSNGFTKYNQLQSNFLSESSIIIDYLYNFPNLARPFLMSMSVLHYVRLNDISCCCVF